MAYAHGDPQCKPSMVVDFIRDRRRTKNDWEFLVHWKGAPVAEDSWESPVTFVHINSQVWLDYAKIPSFH